MADLSDKIIDTARAREGMRPLLEIIFRGWKLHEASYVVTESEDLSMGTHVREKVDCMIEAAGGDKSLGYMAYLMDYWGNDIEETAPHFGIRMSRDEGGVIQFEDCPIDESDPFDSEEDDGSVEGPVRIEEKTDG